ncbi:MAG: hypothetical protein P4L69_10555 [Desulfosporosinus sp.]|nr:hypothetical protein [Desulfosporosinus sp.]
MGKAAQALWQDYHFLTKEMLKFLTKQDMPLFYHLLEQRRRLQTSIEEAADVVFKDSPAGQSLLNEIQKENQIVIDHLQSRMSHSKRQFQMMKAYSGTASTGPASRKTWNR